MPVAVFAGVVLALGIVMIVLANGGSKSGPQNGGAGVVAPPGYEFAYRYVGDVTGVERSDLPDEWICMGEGPASVWTSCFAPSGGGLGGMTVDQLVAIGTLLVGAFSAVATFYVGLRGLRQNGGSPTNGGPV